MIKELLCLFSLPLFVGKDSAMFKGVCGVGLLLVGLAACSMAPINVSTLNIAQPPTLVSGKSASKIYIVIDDSKFPNSYTIPRGDIKETRIFDLHHFITVSLKDAAGKFFSDVEVVGPSKSQSLKGHLVADVSMGKLYYDVATATAGTVTASRVLAGMSWAFAIRRPGSEGYVYSFSRDSIGTKTLLSVDGTDDTFRSTFEVAIKELITDMEASKVFRLKGLTTNDDASVL